MRLLCLAWFAYLVFLANALFSGYVQHVHETGSSILIPTAGKPTILNEPSCYMPLMLLYYLNLYAPCKSITSFTTPCRNHNKSEKASNSKNTISTSKPRKTEYRKSNHAHGESHSMAIEFRKGTVACCAFVFCLVSITIQRAKKGDGGGSLPFNGV